MPMYFVVSAMLTANDTAAIGRQDFDHPRVRWRGERRHELIKPKLWCGGYVTRRVRLHA